MSPLTTFEIPRLRSLARHALPHVLEATLIPLALFYGAMALLGVWGALAAALVWSYGAILVRVVTKRRVPGVLMLGALGLTARTALALASGSVFVYFLQPSLGTLLVAGTFLLSVPVGRPLAEKLAADFCPLPEPMAQHPTVRTFFARVSLLWGFVYMVNASVTIWLLLNQSLTTFMWAKTAAGTGLTLTAIAVSMTWFMISMRSQGIHVVRTAPVPAAVS